MRRLLAAFAVVAATATAVSGGAFAAYSTTRSNSATSGTASSFLPVNQIAPSISGTVALTQTLSLTRGTWGYASPSGGTVDTSGRQSVATPSDQWQYCVASVCTNISGATGTTLPITSALLTSLGLLSLDLVSFKVQETATNASGTASAVASNTLS